MFGKLAFLAILALTQARPEGQVKRDHLEPHELCPPAETHWLLPHESDCTLFYYCEYGLKWKEPRECAEGTEFSYELQVCVHPDEANCNLPGSPTSAAPASSPDTTTAAPTSAPTTSAPVTEAPVVEESNEEDGETELLPNGCPADPNVDLLLPHSDCGKFYQCAHGEKVLQSCPEGEHFNVAEQRCDWPAYAGCDPNAGGGDGGNGENGGEDGGNGENGGENGGEDGGNGENGGEDGGNGDSGGNSGEDDGNGSEEILPNGCPADYTVEQLFPHSDCSKFYQCAHGEKIEMSCPAGEHFNAAENKCDWPSNAGCDANAGGDGGSSENGGEDGGNGDNSGENGENGGGDGGNGENGGGDGGNGESDGGSGSSEVEILPNGCPSDPTVNVLLPHADCGNFYQCVHGEKVVRSCPEGEHFNVAEQKCDWPSNAGCDANAGGGDGGNEDNGGEGGGNGENGGGDGENGENGGGNGENGGGDGENGGGNGENGGGDGGNGGGDGGNGSGEVEILPNGCPSDPTVNVLLPHADCGNFYQCVHGEKVVRSCPEGEHFNVAEQKCDWPSNAGCDANAGGGDGGNGDNGGEGGGNGENGGGDGGNGENGGGDGENGGGNGENGGGDGENGGGDGGNGSGEIEILPNGCPSDPTVNVLLPHANCGNFYQCVHGEKVVRSCPEGEHFNVAEQKCDWPSNAGCDANAGGGDSGNGDNGGEGSGNGENGGGDGGNGENGGGDGENGGGNGENGGGDGENGGGDGGNGSGEIEILPNGCPSDPTVNVLLPHANCGNFYQCVHGEKVVRSCPEGEHFNVAEQKCDWPSNAGCDANAGGGDGGNGDNGGEGSGNGENGGGDGENGENGGGDGENGGGNGENGGGDGGNGSGDGGNGSGEVEILPNGCPSDPTVNVLLPHADCGNFYQCVHGEKVVRSCPEGEHFNVAEQRCDWPSNAGCDANSGGEDGGNGDNGGEDGGNGENGGGDGENGENGGEDGENGGGNGENGGGDGGNGGGDGGNGSGEVEILPNGCPSDPTVNVLLPHADCGNFYQCVHGEKVVRSCPEGEHFNVAEQVCDWPWNAGCDSSENGGGDNGGSGNGDGENGGGENGNRCADGCNILPWAHATDCDKFWRCNGEVANLVTCPEGLKFNAASGTCDLASRVNC